MVELERSTKLSLADKSAQFVANAVETHLVCIAERIALLLNGYYRLWID